MARALLALVRLVEEHHLQHQLHSGRLVQIEFELLEDLELGLDKHFGDEFDA